MKKCVNGIEVDCTADEQTAIEAEWQQSISEPLVPVPTILDVIAVLSPEQQAAIANS